MFGFLVFLGLDFVGLAANFLVETIDNEGFFVTISEESGVFLVS